MSSKLNSDVNFGETSLKGNSDAQNLEFDFNRQKAASAAAFSSTTPKTAPSNSAAQTQQTASEPQRKESSRTQHTNPQRPSSMSTSPSSSSSSSPSFSQYQQNVRRQTREQSAVGSLLSGVAFVLVSSIILLTVLSGFGGWYLFKQIKGQSATLSQLDGKFTQRNTELQDNLRQSDEAIGQLQILTRLQKQQITGLQGQLEDTKSQSKKDLAAERLKNQKLEARVYELERKWESR